VAMFIVDDFFIHVIYILDSYILSNSPRIQTVNAIRFAIHAPRVAPLRVSYSYPYAIGNGITRESYTREHTHTGVLPTGTESCRNHIRIPQESYRNPVGIIHIRTAADRNIHTQSAKESYRCPASYAVDSRVAPAHSTGILQVSCMSPTGIT